MTKRTYRVFFEDGNTEKIECDYPPYIGNAGEVAFSTEDSSGYIIFAPGTWDMIKEVTKDEAD